MEVAITLLPRLARKSDADLTWMIPTDSFSFLAAESPPLPSRCTAWDLRASRMAGTRPIKRTTPPAWSATCLSRGLPAWCNRRQLLLFSRTLRQRRLMSHSSQRHGAQRRPLCACLCASSVRRHAHCAPVTGTWTRGTLRGLRTSRATTRPTTAARRAARGSTATSAQSRC